MSFLVRDAREDDFARIADLTVRVYVGEGFSSSEATASLSDVRGRAATADLLVAADDRDDVLGAVFLVLTGPLRQIGTPDEAEVRLLSVEPSARRQGVGQALIKACMARAAAADRAGIVLSTQPTMESAQRLYERLGFQRTPGRDWKRRSGRDMLVYTLLLSNRAPTA